MSARKERRGGVRPGAGRPSLEQEQRADCRLNLRLPPDLFARLQNAAELRQLPVSTYARQLIEMNVK